jgi:hypothetical protein
VRRRLLIVLGAVAVLASGCGGDSSSETTTTAAETHSVRVYLLRDGKVWPVSRELAKTGIFQLEDELRRGPTEEERGLGFTSEVAGGDDANPSRAALAQRVYTFTQSDPTGSYEINGKSYTRADFEDQTPLILVESPLPFEQVSGPIRVTGTANTFEATFQYELLDSEGNVVDKNFVTATSGTGTRGTFDFTTADVSDAAKLVVFENSAENGARINKVEIPLTAAS